LANPSKHRKEMDLVFLYVNKIFTFQDITMSAEFVKFKDVESIDYIMVRRENFEDFIENNKDSIKDFSYEDNSLIINHDVLNIPLGSPTSAPEEYIKTSEKIISMYQLLNELIKRDCLYLHNIDYLDDYAFVPRFSDLKVSKSTMHVGISSFSLNLARWSTNKIIYMDEDNQLKQNDFICLIPEESVKYFNIFGLKYLRETKVNGSDKTYFVYEYRRTLPLCSSTHNFIFSPPHTVHYSYVSYIFKSITTCVKELLYSEVEGDKEELQNKSEVDIKVYKNNLYGIFFTLKKPVVNKDIAESYIDAAQQLVKIEKERNSSISMKALRTFLEQQGFGEISPYCIKELMSIIETSSKGVRLDYMDIASQKLTIYKKKLLETELMLFNTRVSCIMHDSALKAWNHYTSFFLQGSMYDTSIKVTRKEAPK
jgi:hypothetical protein